MPFTPAHVAAVLPLMGARKRLGLDATCLVIGSMAPDLEYFARGMIQGTVGHTALGILTWNIPVTLLVAILFHGLTKWPSLAALPGGLASRAVVLLRRDWPERWSLATVAGLLASAAVGSVSHMVWDAATHQAGWIVLRVPALQGTLAGVPVYTLAQHGSTVVGLTLVTAVLLRALLGVTPAPLPAEPRVKLRVAFAVIIAAFVASYLGRLVILERLRLGDIVAACGAGMMVGLLVASGLSWRIGARFKASIRAG